ncbi:MAG: glycosyltransferase [Bryobacteraceae bacterium]
MSETALRSDRTGTSSKQIRVAYLVTQYPAISHTFILREIVGLRQRGVVVDVASVNSPDRPAAGLSTAEAAEAATTHYIKNVAIASVLAEQILFALRHPLSYLRGLAYAWWLAGTSPSRVLRYTFYFAEAVLLGKWMERKGQRHLHVHFATSGASVGLITSRLFQTSLSMTVHGPEEFDDVTWHRLAEKVRQCRFVSCIGYFARTQLMKISDAAHWDKLEIAPLGVNLDDFSPAGGMSETPTVEIVCVARLAPVKGHRVLIQAMEKLTAAGVPVRARLIGDGPERKALEAMVKARGLEGTVKLEGAMNPDRIREALAKADIFALPSFDEGIPVSLMEAMAMEIPCISTYVGGIPELMRNGIDGYLISPSDPDSLAQVISELVSDPALRSRIGLAGRIRVSEKYNLPANIDRLATIFGKYLSTGERI